MMSTDARANVKQQKNPKGTSDCIILVIRSTLKLEIQSKKGVYVSFNSDCYSVKNRQGGWGFFI